MTRAAVPSIARRPVGAGADELFRACAPDEIPYATTAEAPTEAGAFGQDRALEATLRATEIASDGFNVFATGPPGTGKRAMVEAWLGARAATRPAPSDLVCLANFADPLRPRTVPLPAGSARALAEDVDRLVQEARVRIAEAFGSESYRTRHRALHDDIDRRRDEVLEHLAERAHALDVALQLTPAGAITAPVVAGRPLEPEEMQRMPPEARERYAASVAELKPALDDTFAAMQALDREARDRHLALNREIAVYAIGHLVDEARERWAPVAAVVAEWIDALREDAIANLERFRGEPSDEEEEHLPFAGAAQSGFLTRYAVNVLVTHDPTAGAPVVVVTDPSFYDLFGRAEYETAFGAAVTDHRHLRAGAVHEAAGGYLVLDAAELLSKPFVWPRLKDVLRTGRIKIENLSAQYTLFPGVTLDPEPADVRLTVVLVGDTRLYQLLHAVDDDVARLFKLRADFDAEMPRDEDGIRAYASLLARTAAQRSLPPFDRTAMAALVEHGGRLAEHRDRLSTGMRAITDVAAEAGHLAAAEGAELVAARHVEQAHADRRRRSGLLEQRLLERVLDGTLRIDVGGAVIGQVNGLAVVAPGDHEFGHPIRITATVAPGESGVVDIDREAELSGPLHAKGFLILSGFLAARYSPRTPMSLRASLVLEQSYGPVEGDSASAAELLALLSALAGLPVDQGIAVTGAVDQHGAIQAVGGVNEKIEGFFRLCEARGLTGRQGVIVPRTNLPSLMLARPVVEAVRDARFHVWPVDTIDDALDLLLGYEGSVNDLIRERLDELARAARAAKES